MNAKPTQKVVPAPMTAHRIISDSRYWDAVLNAQNALTLCYTATSRRELEAYTDSAIYAAAIMRFALRGAKRHAA